MKMSANVPGVALSLFLIIVPTLGHTVAQQKAPAKKQQRRSMSPREVAKKVFPSVVEVLTEKADGSPGTLGSGFFVRPDMIVTNYHVIKGASNISARVVGSENPFIVRFDVGDEAVDLALLRTETSIGRPLSLGDWRSVKVGDEIFAIGNPKGFEGTFSQGIVSGLRGNNYIQITAPISRGSSGGPILNNRGEVVGIATLTYEGGQNLNFAVSVSSLATLVAAVDYTGSRPRVVGKRNSPSRANTLVSKYDVSAEDLFDAGKSILYSEPGGTRSESSAQKASPYFEEALKKERDYAEAWLELGNCYFTQSKYLEAAENYIQAIRVNSYYFEAHQTLGLVYKFHADSLSKDNHYKAIGFYEKAADSFKHATFLKPNDALTFVYLGESLSKSQHDSEAERAFSKSLMISPNDPAHLLFLGDTYNNLDRHQDALNVLTRVVRIEPDKYGGYRALGETFRGLGMDALIRMNGMPSSQSIFLFQKALEHFKKALQLAPELRDYLHYELGITYLVMGDKSSALEEYRAIKDFKGDDSGKVFGELLFKQIYK